MALSRVSGHSLVEVWGEMLCEDSEAAANGADECKGNGVREVLWF